MEKKGREGWDLKLDQILNLLTYIWSSYYRTWEKFDVEKKLVDFGK